MNQAKQERQLAHVVNMELEHALETMPWPSPFVLLVEHIDFLPTAVIMPG